MTELPATASSGELVLQADEVAVAGDWHCNRAFAELIIHRLHAHNQQVARADGSQVVSWIWHAGDFSVWPTTAGERYLDAVQAGLEHAGLRILVTPGNHEDWGRLRVAFAQAGYVRPWSVRPNIAFLPPGFRFTAVTTRGVRRKVLSVGGAPSIDYESREARVDWWPGEVLTPADEARCVDGGRADIVVAHDAPDGSAAAVRRIVATNPEGWSSNGLEYAARGRASMNRIYSAVLPELWLHGHYHVGDTQERRRDEAGLRRADNDSPDGTTTFVSLHRDNNQANTVLLDLDTYETQRLL